MRDHYTRTRGVELVLDREAATELVRLLIPVVGRTEIGLLIDSHRPRISAVMSNRTMIQ